MTHPSRRRGFSLLEILVVITLISLLVTAVAPRISTIFRASVTSSVRRYGALVRYAYDQSVLTGRIHRIVLNLDDQTWAVESAEEGQLPVDRYKTSLTNETTVAPDPKFKVAGNNLLDKIPNGVQIVRVDSWRLGPKGGSATKGEVSIYAYPSGFIDEATVVLAEIGKQEVQRFKVTTKTLTGRVKVETEMGELPPAATSSR